MARAQVVDFAPAGLVQDVPPYAAPANAWTGMANMRTNGAGVERVQGLADFVTTQIPAKFAMSAIANGEVWLLYMGALGVYVTNGTTHFDVTPTAGWTDFNAGEMTGGLLNDYACFNAPNRAPWYWDRTFVVGAVKPLPGWITGATGNVLAPFNQHLFSGSSFDTQTRLSLLRWSDVAAPNTVPASWVPTATNQAGDLQLATGAGRITVMRGLGQQLMVYRTTGCYAVQYVGRPYIYVARAVSANVGCATPNAVAEVRGAHVILSPGDLMIADGTTVRSIGEARVKRTIFANMSQAGLLLGHVYALAGSGEVTFCLALGQDEACNVAYVWNYERDEWSLRDLPQVQHSFATFVPSVVLPSTWDTDAGTWDSDFVAWDAGPGSGFQPRAITISEAASRAYLVGVGDLGPGGAAISAYAERLSIPVGNPATVKLTTKIFPRIEGTPGDRVTVQVGAQIGPGDLVKWEAPKSFEIGGRDSSVDCLAVGRLLSVRFSSSERARWSVAGFSAQYAERSRV